MSGDVQPRKRKDKRKKREGSSLGNIHEPLPPKFRGKSFDEDADTTQIIGSTDQGEKIHVHNDHGIGGNVCVKIVFFCLLGALVTVVSIIFIHSRGSTDVDLPSIEDSRFADYFTGWLDDATDDHGHGPEELPIEDEGHDEHDEVEEEPDHGEDKEEQSEETEAEKSEEDHVDEQEVGDEAKENSDEAIPEGNENEEEDNVDDSGDEEDEAVKIVETDEEDDEVAPKFKVVHRFRHFFNKRKQLEPDKAEEDRVVKKKRYTQLKRDVQEIQVDETEESEEDENEDITQKLGKDEDNDKDEDEDENENEDEGKYTTDKIEDDEEEDEEKSETDDGSMEEEDSKYEHTGNVESKEVGKEEEDEMDEDEETERVENDEKDEAEEEDLSEGEKTDEEETLKDDLGLDEIDESEEALEEEEEEEKISLSDRGISIREEKEENEEEEKLEETDEKFGTDDVKDEEIEEVESKILDIEEKLNQILREKRRKVEQRKMELEEIEIGPPLEENEDKEKEVEEQEETESNGVAVKLIVGIALIIAAHMVLIQKWNSLGNAPADEKSEAETEDKQVISVIGGTEPIISRRQTLVPETSDLNKNLANESEEETGEEDEEDGDEEQDEDEYEEEDDYEEDINEEPDYSNDKALVKEGKLWKVEYGNRLINLTKANEEYAEEEEEEEELDDGELEEEDVEEEEEEDGDEEEEDVEEDDYDWKRLEPVDKPVKDEMPVPPPRRSHMSGERRGGPQDIDDLSEINAFDDFWDGADSIDQGDRRAEEEQEDKDVEDKSEDDDIQEDYKFAEDLIDNSPREALNIYEAILSKKPEAVAALIGRAKVLDKVAEKERSNQYLKEAINAYKVILTRHEHDLKNEQFLDLAERCINRMRFGGYFKTAVEIHKLLIRRFPKDPKYRNDLAVTYLFLNEIPSARALLNDTLRMWPKNGFALVHYGFILKTADNKYAEAADLLMAGIRTREPGVIDGRFFFHLGDALNRIGRGKEAIEWYDQGVKEGLFLSRYQRSLYNVNRLKGQPWWTHKETTYQDFFKKLEDNWQQIRNEGLNLLNAKGMNLFKEEAENLKDTGDWRQLDLYFRGKKQPNCDRAPFTCSLISSFLPASTCTRGQIKFSVMFPSTHVWPHCGPTNCRLRSHLGLLVSKNTFIRVAEETRSWEEGKLFVFDDSFEHEVWHNGTGPRLVLIVDVWHPELTPKERKYLSPI